MPSIEQTNGTFESSNSKQKKLRKDSNPSIDFKNNLIKQMWVCNNLVVYIFQLHNIYFLRKCNNNQAFGFQCKKNKNQIMLPTWMNIFIIYSTGRSWYARNANTWCGWSTLLVIWKMLNTTSSIEWSKKCNKLCKPAWTSIKTSTNSKQ